MRLAVVGMCLFLFACGESNVSRNATTANSLSIDMHTTLAEVLAANDEGSVDILFEISLGRIAPVAERVAQLKQEFDARHRDNSICFAGSRAEIGKTAFTCNDYDYDVLILARRGGQSISANLDYIEEMVQDPLHVGLVQVIEALRQNPMDDADEVCTRMVFRDATSGRIREDIPTILMIELTALMDQDKGVESLLRACLE